MSFSERCIITVRSLLFYFGYVGSGMIQGSICKVLPFFVPLKKRFAYITSWNIFVVWWLKVSCNIKLHIDGEENIPEGPCIVLSKHQSPWETMFLLPRFNPLAIILKKELLRIPFFGWGLESLDPIPIDRGSPKAALKQIMSIGVERIKDGYSVLVFPEGTRIDPGEAGSYARSGSNLSIRTGAPVIFVAHNAGNSWRAHKFMKLPGSIKVKFSEPVYPEGHTSKSLMDLAKNWIETEVKEMGDHSKPYNPPQ